MGKAENLALPEIGSHALGTGKLPVDHYVSPQFFELEKKHIFRKSWLLVGRASDLKEPGDYQNFLVDTLGVSVVVVRGRDQQLRAFYNACTHRGSRLVNSSTGNTRALVCSFHGWSFSLDGALINVPDAALFADLDPAQEHLKSISVDVWGGFIFINLAEQPEWTLQQYLMPLGDAFDRYLGNKDWSWSFGWRANFRANWKLLVDAQIEGYHVDMTHRKTIAGTVPGSSTAAYFFPESVGVPCGVSAYRPEDSSRGVQTPLNLLSAKYGATSIYTKPERTFAAEGGEGVLKEDHPLWIFDNYLLFPNIVLFVQKGQIIIQRTLPISADECIWEVDFYHTEKPASFGHIFNREQGVIQIRDVLSEDLYTAEGIHANFKCGAITHVNLNKQEVPLRAYYNRLLSAVQGGKVKGAP